eukprot:TRINITY_DN3966_c0_g2_i2.p1 TRINITY_DN3966_c0_g2~~TRINITY_DN3966_c0_g2_i2.p1  ORF type:complete len:643 (+),score=187.20 TRINITY_DN3966_c0_g2_i2:1440-3368(+)
MLLEKEQDFESEHKTVAMLKQQNVELEGQLHETQISLQKEQHHAHEHSLVIKILSSENERLKKEIDKLQHLVVPSVTGATSGGALSAATPGGTSGLTKMENENWIVRGGEFKETLERGLSRIEELHKLLENASSPPPGGKEEDAGADTEALSKEGVLMSTSPTSAMLQDIHLLESKLLCLDGGTPHGTPTPSPSPSPISISPLAQSPPLTEGGVDDNHREPAAAASDVAPKEGSSNEKPVAVATYVYASKSPEPEGSKSPELESDKSERSSDDKSERSSDDKSERSGEEDEQQEEEQDEEQGASVVCETESVEVVQLRDEVRRLTEQNDVLQRIAADHAKAQKEQMARVTALEREIGNSKQDQEKAKAQFMQDLDNRCQRVVELELQLDEYYEKMQDLQPTAAIESQRRHQELRQSLIMSQGEVKRQQEILARMTADLEVACERITSKSERIFFLEQTLKDISHQRSAKQYKQYMPPTTAPVTSPVKHPRSNVLMTIKSDLGKIAKPIRGGGASAQASTPGGTARPFGTAAAAYYYAAASSPGSPQRGHQQASSSGPSLFKDWMDKLVFGGSKRAATASPSSTHGTPRSERSRTPGVSTTPRAAAGNATPTRQLTPMSKTPPPAATPPPVATPAQFLGMPLV